MCVYLTEYCQHAKQWVSCIHYVNLFIHIIAFYQNILLTCQTENSVWQPFCFIVRINHCQNFLLKKTVLVYFNRLCWFVYIISILTVLNYKYMYYNTSDSSINRRTFRMFKFDFNTWSLRSNICPVTCRVQISLCLFIPITILPSITFSSLSWGSTSKYFLQQIIMCQQIVIIWNNQLCRSIFKISEFSGTCFRYK